MIYTKGKVAYYMEKSNVPDFKTGLRPYNTELQSANIE